MINQIPVSVPWREGSAAQVLLEENDMVSGKSRKKESWGIWALLHSSLSLKSVLWSRSLRSLGIFPLLQNEEIRLVLALI